MSIGANIAKHRKTAGLTQTDLADQIGVSFQAVSSWERDECQPDAERLQAIAAALNITVGVLFDSALLPPWKLNERIFNEDHMFTFIRATANAKNLPQTNQLLGMSRLWHSGQTRKGPGDVPYINHPLTMACQALAMGLYDDDLLSIILLHDVVEDCGISPDDLPLNETVRQGVRLMTHPADNKCTKAGVEAYYRGIRQNPMICLIKCMDRCNNLSTMAMGFTREKMVTYLSDTEKWVLPLLKEFKNVTPLWSNAAWLLQYQMVSLMETIKRLL